MTTKGKAAFAALACVLLVVSTSTSCGDFFPSSNAIVAITISPAPAGVQLSAGTEQFSAQGTFGNNSTGDVTGQVNWSSSNSGVATINQAGLATAVAAGVTTITAKSSSASANTTLTVLSVTTITITVASGQSTNLTAGQSVQLYAKDQNGNDITDFVTWNDNGSNLVSVSNGLVTAQATLSVGGTVPITATITGKSGSTVTSNTINVTVSL